MAVNLSPIWGAGAQLLDNSGNVLSGGKIYTYAAGTTTPATTYTNTTGTVPNSNPIILNSAGRVPYEIWFTDGVEYKFILTDSNDVLIGTWDNLIGVNDITPSTFSPSATSLLPDPVSFVDAFNDVTDESTGSQYVGYESSATSAVPRTVYSKLGDIVSVKDFGAVGDGGTNDTAAFTAAGSSSTNVQVLIPAGTYNLVTSPAPTGNVTWIVQKGASFTGSGTLSYLTNKIVSYGDYESIENDPSFYNGIFGYLENNAAEKAYGTIGLHGSVQSAGGTGASDEVDIGVAGFAVNNITGGAGAVYGMYSTVLRQSGATGYTHGMEIDVANYGTTIEMYPASAFPAGLTSGLWLATGGESTVPSAGGSPGIATVALAIIQNDSQVSKTAQFDKGIVFHNTAIKDADGTGGTNLGCAIAFAVGHSMRWFNNSNQITGEITNSGATFADTNTRMDFANSSVNFEQRDTGNLIFGIGRTGTINFNLATQSATAGALVGYITIQVGGTDYKLPYYAMS